MAAFLTETQLDAITQAYNLLDQSNISEVEGIPEDVAKRLVKIAGDLGFQEPDFLTKVRDRPIKTLLEGLIYLNANA